MPSLFSSHCRVSSVFSLALILWRYNVTPQSLYLPGSFEIVLVFIYTEVLLGSLSCFSILTACYKANGRKTGTLPTGLCV